MKLQYRIHQLKTLSQKLSTRDKERALLNLNHEIVPSHTAYDFDTACEIVEAHPQLFSCIRHSDRITQEYIMLRMFDVEAHEAAALASKLRLDVAV
jgi:adenine C2-methylase RlmN of 23S rRNA A2503 and tRNA A37